MLYYKLKKICYAQTTQEYSMDVSHRTLASPPNKNISTTTFHTSL